MEKHGVKLAISITAVLIIVAIIFSFFLYSDDKQETSITEYLNLGDKYLLDMNYEQALVQFLKVIEIEPMNERAYLGAAEAYIRLGRVDEAAAILERGLLTLPDSVAIKAMLAELSPEPEVEPLNEPEPEESRSPESEAASNDELITVSGVLVRSNGHRGPTFSDGIEFVGPIVAPSGESVSVARLAGIEAFDNEWVVHEDNVPVFMEAAYRQVFNLTGRMSFDETHADGVVPHPNQRNLPEYEGTFVNDPWGPYRFDVELVLESFEIEIPEDDSIE